MVKTNKETVRKTLRVELNVTNLTQGQSDNRNKICSNSLEPPRYDSETKHQFNAREDPHITKNEKSANETTEDNASLFFRYQR